MAEFCWTVMQTRSRASVNILEVSDPQGCDDLLHCSEEIYRLHLWRVEMTCHVATQHHIPEDWNFLELPAFYMKVACTFLFSQVCRQLLHLLTLGSDCKQIQKVVLTFWTQYQYWAYRQPLAFTALLSSLNTNCKSSKKYNHVGNWGK